MNPIIAFEKVFFSYEDEYILEGVDFAINKGQMALFIGENGSGKSTVFKLIAGLIKPDKGTIMINDVDIVHLEEDELNEIRKNMGIIFQESALFDSLLVGENVAYPLYERLKLSDEEVIARTREVLSLVELESAIDKFPSELSGGMRKRVAIARALSSLPQILLYDDPTAGLDPITSRTILEIILKLRDIKKITSLVITNQFEEALMLSTLKAEQHDNEILYTSVEGGNPECIFLLLEHSKIITSGSFCELQESSSAYIQEFLS